LVSENKNIFNKLFCKNHEIVVDLKLSKNFQKCIHCGVEFGELLQAERALLEKHQEREKICF